MSREILGGKPALGPEAVALMALGRVLPEYTVIELRDAAAKPGTQIRRALLHFVGGACACAPAALVGEARLCKRGARLIEPARGWRPRPEAVTA